MESEVALATGITNTEPGLIWSLSSVKLLYLGESGRVKGRRSPA